MGLSYITTGCVPGTTGIAYTSFLTAVSNGCPSGCSSCTPDFVTCTACYLHEYRVAVPDGTGQCPCLPGFYLNPVLKACFACPPSLYCKTCEYDVGSSLPKCTSCYCSQHRVFNATTSTCDCDATHHQDGSTAYCALTLAT